MSKILDWAGTVSLAAMFTFTLLSADSSGAAAKTADPRSPIAPVGSVLDTPVNAPQPLASNPELDPATKAKADAEAADAADDSDADDAPVSASSLAELVSLQPVTAPLSRELQCLAGAIYFESKSEPLVGQLAVGRVIVARSRSGRFPSSYCGVVFQPSQFSFVRGNSMPGINKASVQWKNAVAMAMIANDGSWKSPVEGALFFHASRVSPGWRLARVAKVGNHIFYR